MWQDKIQLFYFARCRCLCFSLIFALDLLPLKTNTIRSLTYTSSLEIHFRVFFFFFSLHSANIVGFWQNQIWKFTFFFSFSFSFVYIFVQTKANRMCNAYTYLTLLLNHKSYAEIRFVCKMCTSNWFEYSVTNIKSLVLAKMQAKALVIFACLSFMQIW